MMETLPNLNFQYSAYAFSDKSEYRDYLTIRNDPIRIADPGDDPPLVRQRYQQPITTADSGDHLPLVRQPNRQPITIADREDDPTLVRPQPRPYLKRGAGLQRYQMTTDYFKQGPPALYSKDEFKKAVKPKNKPPMKIAQAIPTRPCPKTLKNMPAKPDIKTFAERRYAMSAVKSFDDEVIPTLRNKTADAFQVPFVPCAPSYTTHRHLLKIPKTPVKKLVLNPRDVESDDFECQVMSDSSCENVEEKIQEITHSSTARKLNYQSEKVENAEVSQPRFQNHLANMNQVEKLNAENDEVAPPRFQNHVANHRVNINQDICEENGRRTKFQIAEAMKRKGLTDNVRKQLGWSVTPKKKRSLCIIRRVTVKKPKVRAQKEEFTIHQLKDKLRQLEEEKRNLQLEIQKNRRLEKENLDEKVSLNKLRKDMETAFKLERQSLEEERLKLTEDQKKFKRDKLLFEKHCQESKDEEKKKLPPREDREEIRQLKEEILKLKESQKTKDARVAAAQAQFRNRIVVLEKENSKLREDVELAGKVTSRKVRFESAGSVQSKVLNAINDQLDKKLERKRPNSARERGNIVAKPLRRTKSAAELKPVARKNPSLNKPEMIHLVTDNTDSEDGGMNREEDSGRTQKDSYSGRTQEDWGRNREVDYGRTQRDQYNGETLEEDSGRTQNNSYNGRAREEDSGRTWKDQYSRRTLEEDSGRTWKDQNSGRTLEEDSGRTRNNECDSGVGSKHSSMESSCIRNVSQKEEETTSTISEIKRRLASLLAPDTNLIVNHCHIPDGDSPEMSGKVNYPQGWTSRDECMGCMPERHVTSPHKTSRSSDKWQASLNITTDTPSYTNVRSNRGGPMSCPRHHAPKVPHAESIWPSCVPDPYVIRTELAGGDVEEEERHTGVRRVFCATCGAFETTYRNRPGYRRTTYPEGNILEELADGVKVLKYKNGTEKKKFPNGDILFIFTNGDRELTTRGCKKLETAQGIIKILFDDGRTETHYPSGRVRIKDRRGHLVMDTGGLPK